MKRKKKKIYTTPKKDTHKNKITNLLHFIDSFNISKTF